MGRRLEFLGAFLRAWSSRLKVGSRGKHPGRVSPSGFLESLFLVLIMFLVLLNTLVSMTLMTLIG